MHKKLKSPHVPVKYLQMLVCFPSMLTTSVSGASPPTKASCPRDNHMCCEAVFTKAKEENVSPQSSYLKLGFCVIVTRSPNLRMIFLVRLGEIKCEMNSRTLIPIMKQNKPAVDKYTISLCQAIVPPLW